eukprot:6150445-Prymnesium_polylepis.1
MDVLARRGVRGDVAAGRDAPRDAAPAVGAAAAREAARRQVELVLQRDHAGLLEPAGARRGLGVARRVEERLHALGEPGGVPAIDARARDRRLRRQGDALPIEQRDRLDHERVVLVLVAAPVAPADRALLAAVARRLAVGRVLRVREEGDDGELARPDREGAGWVERARVYARVVLAVVGHVVRAAHDVVAPSRGRPQRVEARRLREVPRVVAGALEALRGRAPGAVALELAYAAVVRRARVGARVAAVELGAVAVIERVAHREAARAGRRRGEDELRPRRRGERRSPVRASASRLELDRDPVEGRATVLAAGAAGRWTGAGAGSTRHQRAGGDGRHAVIRPRRCVAQHRAGVGADGLVRGERARLAHAHRVRGERAAGRMRPRDAAVESRGGGDRRDGRKVLRGLIEQPRRDGGPWVRRRRRRRAVELVRQHAQHAVHPPLQRRGVVTLP